MLFLHDGLKRGKNKIFVQGTLVMTDDCINQMTMQYICLRDVQLCTIDDCVQCHYKNNTYITEVNRDSLG